MKNKTVLSVSDKQAAFILDVSRQTIYNMKGRGDLPKEITRESVEKYIIAEEKRVARLRQNLVYVVGE